MPTADEVRQYQLLRGRFLAALYDAEPQQHRRLGLSQVTELLEAIGAADLPEGQTTRLVMDLQQAHLVEGMGQSMGDLYPPEVRLTSAGRYEVERWIVTDEPTQHLPMKASVVINDNSVNISGGTIQGSAFVSGSRGTTVNIENQFSAALGTVESEVRKVLAEVDVDTDTRAEVEDDLTSIHEQASHQQPNGTRLRAALKRIGKFVAGAVGAGASAAITASAQDAIADALKLL